MRKVTASLFGLVLLGSSFQPVQAEMKTAIFSGGCFWCIEKDFEHVEGVTEVVSGYTGGTTEKPTYKNHTRDMHLEAVKITYDSTKVSYEDLLKSFWRTVDPTDPGGQFCDRGHSYTTAIFALDEMQKIAAEASKVEAQKLIDKEIVTPIRDAAPFYNAEDYHQDYYKKNPKRYNYYRWACGRNKTVKALWGEQAYAGVSGEH